MVLAGGHWQNVFAIDHHDKARLFTVEELFNHDAVARVAKGVAGQHIVNRGFGFFERHRDDNAFTGSQTVGFNNDRRAFFTEVSQGGLNLGEVLVFRRRDVMTREEIFGEGFRSFQLCGTPRWAEDFQTRGTERVNNANHQRSFGADDGEIDFLVLCKAQQRGNIRHADGDVLQSRFQCRTRITRRDEDGFHPRRLSCFPRQRMLASAVTNH